MHKLMALIFLTLMGTWALADTVKVVPSEVFRSISIEKSEAGLGFTYLSDGMDGLVGISVHTFSLSPKLSLNTLIVAKAEDPTQDYVGTLLTYQVYSQEGLSLSLGVGLKGLDLNQMSLESTRSVLFGVQITVPLR